MDESDQSIVDATTAPDKTTGGVSRLAGLTFGTDADSFHSQEFQTQTRIKKNGKFLNTERIVSSDHTSPAEDSIQSQDTHEIIDQLDSYLGNKHPSKKNKQNGSRGSNLDNQRPSQNASDRLLQSNLLRKPLQSLQANPPEDTLLNDSAVFIISPPSSPDVSKRDNATTINDIKKLTAGRRAVNQDKPIPGGTNHLTLREQEKVIDEVKKDNFNLKLKIYFLEDRLAKLAPDQVDLALKENVEIKVEFQTVRQELKRYKRLLLEAERAIELAKSERDELLEQKSYKEERVITGLEAQVQKLKDELSISDKTTQSLANELQRTKDRLERMSSKNSITNVTSSHARNGTPVSTSIRSLDEWSHQEHAMEIKTLKNELTEERQLKEDLLGDNQELRHRLIETKNALQDTQDEVERISRVGDHSHRANQFSRAQSRIGESHDEYPGSSGRKSTLSRAGGGFSNPKMMKEFRKDMEDLENQIEALQTQNLELRAQANVQVKMLSTKNSEKDQLQDQVSNLKRKILDLQDELDRDVREFQRAQQSGNTSHHDQATDELREELNMYRDKSASALLTLEKREKEVDELNAEIEERDALFNNELEKLTHRFNSDLDSVKSQRDELQEILDEREDQIADLSDQLREVINLQEETDKSLQQVINKLKDKEEDYSLAVKELEATRNDLKEIGTGNRELATEINEKEHQINELNAELDELEQEASNRATVHEQVVTKLKQKLNSTKSEFTELSIQHESCLSELKSLKDKHEELQLKQAEIAERRKIELDSRRKLDRELDDLERALRSTQEDMELQTISSKREKREMQSSFQLALDAKQKALSQAELDVAKLRGRLEVRETDITKLEDTLKKLENESNQLNQSQSHDKFSLELEIERIQRDLSNSNKDYQNLQVQNESLKNQIAKFQSVISNLNMEKDELGDKLDRIEKTRNLLNEKYEEQTKNLRQTQNDLSLAQNRLQSLEDELSSDHLHLNKFENQYKDQITERNNLLLTIYQYIDKLLHNGSANRRVSYVADVKPFSNFTVFHESIINRLKGLGNMQSGFDIKIQEVDTRLEKQYASLKRQHDSRMRQLDRFETTIKATADAQRQWRARLTTKQGEVEAVKGTCTELQKQISSLKQRASIAGMSPGSTSEQRQAVAKVTHLEKKLLLTQNQLKLTEEKFNEAKTKVSNVESSWQARLKELQDRNQELEEKVKREKKSAKDRKLELDQHVQDLKDQILQSDLRSKQLEQILINNNQPPTT